MLRGVLENILRYQKIRNVCASKETTIKESTSRILSTEDLRLLLDNLTVLKEHINGFCVDAGIDKNDLLSKLKKSFDDELLQRLQGTETIYTPVRDKK